MKLLYVASGHPLQEADDCLMWQTLGIEWFSTGVYSSSNGTGDMPTINMNRRNNWQRLWIRQKKFVNFSDAEGTLGGTKSKTWTNQIVANRFRFNRAFVNQFDAILFNHFIDNVEDNWDVCQGKPVFLKTYGMHEAVDEIKMEAFRKKGLKLVRNSPCEKLRGIANYAGEDVVIRGCVVRDEQEISGWSGHEKKVCTFSSYMNDDTHGPARTRRRHYQTIVDNCTYECDLFGVGNNFISHSAKLDILRNYRVNLITGTPNANNTYSFVEAFVMGQPMVIFGQDMWQSTSYEVGHLIEQGKTGFIGKTPTECNRYIKWLMEDHDLAHNISENSRRKALEIYARPVLAEGWKNLFTNSGLIT